MSGDVLGCSSGHRFDLNRRGYVALLGGRSATTGDSAPMLDARDLALDAGALDPVAEAVDAVVPRGGDGRVIDAATGTGHYLERLLRSRPTWGALALDRSPAAVTRSMRRTGADGLVADIWRDWPVRDAAATAVLVVFGPRNPAEFHRVLAPGGSLTVVVPEEDHLEQLHAAGATLRTPADKAARLVDELWPWFEHDQTRPVRADLPVEPATAKALVDMGPAAHHERAAAVVDVDRVTVAVSVLRFRRRRRALPA